MKDEAAKAGLLGNGGNNVPSTKYEVPRNKRERNFIALNEIGKPVKISTLWSLKILIFIFTVNRQLYP